MAGRLTADGGAIVANDMHLGLSTPNIWYRAAMTWRDPRPRRLTGVTLPGVPWLVAGSNGEVAWGFTNQTGDFSDLVIVEPDPTDPNRYRTPSGMSSISTVHETIDVKGGASVPVEIRETIWGPIVERDSSGHERAVAWVPLRDGGMNGPLAAIETADTLEQLFDVAARAGIPAQNIVAAQRDGRIGWSIAGRIPRRVGYDGRLPTSWADGTRGWDGWLAPAEYPRVIDPPEGRIVTANNRLVDDAALRALGDGGYDPGARARQIKGDLEAISRASVRDMLRGATRRSRDLPFALARPPVADAVCARSRGFGQRQRAAPGGERDLDGPGIDRFCRLPYRARVSYARGRAGVRAVDRARPAGRRRVLADDRAQRRGTVVGARCAASAAPARSEVQDLDRALRRRGRSRRRRCEEGRRNRDLHLGSSEYRTDQASRSAAAVPLLGPLLDMPTEELPGDSNMPRVQGPTFGASERFAVSPGRERDGYLHMPTGQSGHPLSPHYRDANPAWVSGAPTPFLPGSTVHTLTLRPMSAPQPINSSLR